MKIPFVGVICKMIPGCLACFLLLCASVIVQVNSLKNQKYFEYVKTVQVGNTAPTGDSVLNLLECINKCFSNHGDWCKTVAVAKVAEGDTAVFCETNKQQNMLPGGNWKIFKCTYQPVM